MQLSCCCVSELVSSLIPKCCRVAALLISDFKDVYADISRLYLKLDAAIYFCVPRFLVANSFSFCLCTFCLSYRTLAAIYTELCFMFFVLFQLSSWFHVLPISLLIVVLKSVEISGHRYVHKHDRGLRHAVPSRYSLVGCLIVLSRCRVFTSFLLTRILVVVITICSKLRFYLVVSIVYGSVSYSYFVKSLVSCCLHVSMSLPISLLSFCCRFEISELCSWFVRMTCI
jgi:hypothetical protein